MTSPLERAAHALADAQFFPGALDQSGDRARLEKAMKDQVRAVLTAIREPSFDMMNAGRDAVLRTHRGGVSGMTIEAQTRNECIREIAAWQAMVDAALSELES